MYSVTSFLKNFDCVHNLLFVVSRMSWFRYSIIFIFSFCMKFSRYSDFFTGFICHSKIKSPFTLESRINPLYLIGTSLPFWVSSVCFLLHCPFYLIRFRFFPVSFVFVEVGSHLLSHAVSSVVSSAAQVLTFVFGMWTGVSPERIATNISLLSFRMSPCSLW